MSNELIEALQDKPIANKIRPYLQRREIIFNYAQACVGELAQKLESAEIENATLILIFKDSDSGEVFNENKEDYYLPHFRSLYPECKRRVETLGVASNIHFTSIHATTKIKKERPTRTIFYRRPIKPININLTCLSDFTKKCFSKMIKQNNDRYLQQKNIKSEHVI